MNKKLFRISILLLSGLLLSCGEWESNVVTGNRDQVLHFGNGTSPSGLDPHIVTGVPEHHVITALMEGLVSLHPKDLHIIPGVAETWEISENLLEYTFHLRRDAKWSNGDTVTAHDFVYSWQRILSPELAAEYAYMLYYLDNGKAFNRGEISDFSKVGVKALDDFTLKVTLHSPTPFFLSLIGGHYSAYPVHKPTIEKFGGMTKRNSRWTRQENHVGNGPFYLAERKLNRPLKVKKSPHYWDRDKVELEEIIFYPTENVTTEELLFRSNQLHYTDDLPTGKFAVYKENSPELLKSFPYLGTYYYMFNVERKPFDDIRVRKALSLAMNRKDIVEKVTKQGQLPAYAFVPPNIQTYQPIVEIKEDIEEAKRLLAEAGYPNGEGFPKIELLYNTSESHKKIAVAFQDMIKKALNIEIELVNQEWKVYLESLNNADFGLARRGWIGDYPDPNTFLDMFLTGGGNNEGLWSNQEYDQLIAQAGQVKDQAERFAIFQQAEKILIDDIAILPIYYYSTNHLISPSVKGLYPNVLDSPNFKFVSLSENTEAQ